MENLEETGSNSNFEKSEYPAENKEIEKPDKKTAIDLNNEGPFEETESKLNSNVDSGGNENPAEDKMKISDEKTTDASERDATTGQFEKTESELNSNVDSGDNQNPAKEKIKKIDEKTNAASGKTVNVSGGIVKHSSSVSKKNDQPEQSSKVWSTRTIFKGKTTAQLTNTGDKNGKTDTSKYNLKHARTIDNHTLIDKDLTSEDNIPNYVFQNLIIGNYHVREFEFKPSNLNENFNEGSYDSDKIEDVQEVNPMDAILDIFRRSDDSLQRYLNIKLSSCQLSVPFLLPDPEMPSENVVYLLPALRNITKCWKDGTCTKQVFATEHPFPVVSFIRIGEPTMSKSLLINKIMSDGDSYHDYFFHKDMKGGHVERKFVDGLVELSWFLPGGSEKQTLRSEICFANLRGDAKSLKKQLDVLLKISSVLCILLPSNYPNETDKTIPKDFLQEALPVKGKTILIFNDETKQTNAKEYFKELNSKNHKKFFSITKAKEKNEDRFLKRIRNKIQTSINGEEASPLLELTHLSEDDTGVDDVHHQFELAWLMDLGIEEAKHYLKLQRHIPVLANLEREKYCPRQSKTGHMNRDTDEIDDDIAKEKMAQKESFQQLDEGLHNYFKDIAVMEQPSRDNALNILKHHLDKMSLQSMDKLQQDYCKSMLDLRENRERMPQKSDTQSSEMQHLKQLGESISTFSFGFEHIIRELAQIYDIQEENYDYAGAAADMLLSGYPLEILDGDSSYIPLRWFNAVYTKLEQKTKNAKMFVISVVGIQSSGKSTMLNTMFGLEFPVSAGRCTRGVFVCLLPVSDSLKSASKFDYVLIVDTEGLDGSTDPLIRQHDNELAIFAIGIADLAIMNVFSENQSMIRQFLEIAVHAFLKMKLVDKKKFCKIVHQNVNVSHARGRLVANRSILRQWLDEMTRRVATHEKIEGKFNKFKDVISFNEDEDVFYLPSMLKGNPPMAPLNPDYGKAIQKLKEDIIRLMCNSEKCHPHPVSQFRKRVNDLWEAILKENFIFSLRKSIETSARMSLDRKYLEESIAVMMTGMAELEHEIVVSLKRCSTENEREAKWADGQKEISKVAEELERTLLEAMNDFLETSEHTNTLKQWKSDVQTKVKEEKEIRISKVTKNCSSTFKHLQSVQDNTHKKLKCEEKLIEKAKEFITSGLVPEDERKLKETFESRWQIWIKSIQDPLERKIDTNEEKVKKYVTTKKSSEEAAMIEIKRQNEKINVDDLEYSTQLTKHFSREKNKCLSRAEEIKKAAIKKALDFAKTSPESTLNNDHLEEIEKKLYATLDEGTKELPFKFKKSTKCHILHQTFCEAIKFFHDTEDIRKQIEKDFQPELEVYLINVCRKMGNEMLAATSFVHVLQNQIESKLNCIMGSVVAKEISKKEEFQNKAQFHVRVLIQLGEEGNFESYTSYFQNPHGFLKEKLTESIVNYCSETIHLRIDSLHRLEIEKIETVVLNAISILSNGIKTENKKLSFWIQRFVEECSCIALKKEMFCVATIEDLQNMELFLVEVRKKINQIFKSLKSQNLLMNAETFHKWNPSPVDCLVDTLFPCASTCPFCETICDNTILNHEVHFALSHRPLCIIGSKNENTQILITDICTKTVAGKKKFRNMETHWEGKRYKDYQSVNDHYKSWNICPDSTSKPSMYWKWFMGKFSKELSEYYGGKLPTFPKFGKHLTFDKVKEQLQKEFNL
ncbi:interferon-induced very large GTPase 1-like [Dendronephthya gigantea]|uniref:interferon-induced very large GTPase 1-like n=1 Tax=Dendronephthya gigantea TaxID=151771 RepID=UPI00106D0701|nr:interferon-induced very large GTPase 1-like [Dendronephthya gigantea]